MPINNTVYAFALEAPGQTRVTVATAHGLQNGNVVEILNSANYIGTWSVSSVDAYSFVIAKAYTTNEQGCKWQISRTRPVVINIQGDSIDTLRQGVNQISNDLGNKLDLDLSIADRTSLVRALNSFINQGAILNLIVSIATN